MQKESVRMITSEEYGYPRFILTRIIKYFNDNDKEYSLIRMINEFNPEELNLIRF